MPKNSLTIHKEFQKKVKELNEIRRNFEVAFNAGNINAQDIIQAYSGLYLETFTYFENLIEMLFLGMISGEVAHHNSIIVKKIKIKPATETQAVIFAQKPYLDWLPFDKTIPRANIYFTDGKPFSLLTTDQNKKLTNYHKIRNAIAHKSGKAILEFEKIINGLTLLPIEKTPTGYLRNIPSAATNKTQLQIISEELVAISFTLCN